MTIRYGKAADVDLRDKRSANHRASSGAEKSAVCPIEEPVGGGPVVGAGGLRVAVIVSAHRVAPSIEKVLVGIPEWVNALSLDRRPER